MTVKLLRCLNTLRTASLAVSSTDSGPREYVRPERHQRWKVQTNSQLIPDHQGRKNLDASMGVHLYASYAQQPSTALNFSCEELLSTFEATISRWAHRSWPRNHQKYDKWSRVTLCCIVLGMPALSSSSTTAFPVDFHFSTQTRKLVNGSNQLIPGTYLHTRGHRDLFHTLALHARKLKRPSANHVHHS